MPSSPQIARLFVASFLLLVPLGAFAGQATTRVENPSFSATVTSFQTSVGSNGLHFMTASVHFQNRTRSPLILACDPKKVGGSDDRGNRYVGTLVRGIGTIDGAGVDSKFALPPNGGGDVLVELRTRLDARVERGVAFDLDLPVREIAPLEGGQVKLGTERAVEFAGLKTGFAADLPDRTVDAGPFTAQIVRTKFGTTANRRWKTLDMTVRLTNASDKPLTLAYEAKSSFATDEQGNRYGYGGAGTTDASATGIGVASGDKADPQFVLGPGESREVHLTVVRMVGRETDGTELTYSVALQQLQILPSGQIREVRQFSLTFPGLSSRR